MLLTVLRQRSSARSCCAASRASPPITACGCARGASQELIGRIMPYNIKGEDPPPLTTSESSKVLVEWEGGAYTMGDAFQDLRNGQIPRPNFNVMPSVERWLGLRAIERTALLEALRRQLDQDPDLQRASASASTTTCSRAT
mgnify:CR=1 FL=1